MAYKSFSFTAAYNTYAIERLSKGNSINVDYERNTGSVRFEYDEWYNVNSVKVIKNRILIARDFAQGLPPHLEESAAYQNLKIKIKYTSESAGRVRILSEAAASTSAVEYANSLPGSGDIYLSPAERITASEETITSAEMQNILAYGMSFGASAKGYGLLSGIEISGEMEDLAYRGTASDIIPAENSILVANAANTIKWTYSQPYDAPQYYVTIKGTYKDTGETVTICNKSNITEPKYTIPAGKLRNGAITLNIAVLPQAADYYPADDSAWTAGTEVTYRVKTNPQTSALTCDGKPMPTLTWTSSGQSAYQIRFGDYDTGVITGDAQSYQIPTLFEDGAYPAQIRIASSDGTWSEWSDTTYIQIANVPPSNLEAELSAKIVNNNVQLSSTLYVLSGGTSIVVSTYAFYRDGKICFWGTGGQKIDKYANGRTTYFVRMVKSDGYYLQSNAVTIDIRPPCDLISADGGDTYDYLRYTQSAKTHAITERNAVTYQYYAGRTRPVAVSSGQTEKVMACIYAFRDFYESKKLTKYSGREIMLKTTRGAIIRGVMDNLDIISGRITTVSFNVRETDAEEQ